MYYNYKSGEIVLLENIDDLYFIILIIHLKMSF